MRSEAHDLCFVVGLLNPVIGHFMFTSGLSCKIVMRVRSKKDVTKYSKVGGVGHAETKVHLLALGARNDFNLNPVFHLQSRSGDQI